MPVKDNLSFLQGGGQMGAMIRSSDWSGNPLGEPETWPDSLRSALSISLNSGFPIAIYWGSEFILLYNDAWSSIPGDKHPWALGKPGAEVWPEIWEGLEDEFKGVLEKGESYHRPDALLPMYRYGYTEECYFDYTLSPVIATNGNICGVFNAVIETTYKFINERRNNILHQFQRRLHMAHGYKEGVHICRQILSSAVEDIVFSVLYTVNTEKEREINLSSCIGIPEEEVSQVSWPIWESLDRGGHIHISNLTNYFPAPVTGYWPEPCREAFIAPIAGGEAKIKGCIIFGVSPRKKLDSNYQHFLLSAALHTGTILNNSYAHEQSEIYQREQQLNEELMAANEELSALNEELRTVNEQLQESQENLKNLNNELEERVAIRTLELKRARREALARGERLKRLFMQAPAGICILEGPNLVFELINPAFENIFPGRQLQGEPIAKVLPELDAHNVLENLRQVFLTGESYEGTELMINMPRIQGGVSEKRYFTFLCQARIDLFGRTDGVLIFVYEVTAMVNSRQLLENNEKRIRFLLDAMPQQVWTAGPEGLLDYVNQRMISDTGVSSQDMIEKGWPQIVHPDDLAPAANIWNEAAENMSEYMNEGRIRMQDGTYKWHLARALPFVEEGRIKLWIGTNTDIDFQKTAEQKKDEFISIASHELKTPLTSIKAFNQLMQRTEERAKLNTFVEKSAIHISRLEKLISDLLDVTRINAGKMAYRMEPFPFHKMLTESIEDIMHTNPSHRVILHNNTDIIYTGDQFRLSQVMHNFLSNAAKYSPDGNEIIVTCTTADSCIVVSVRDFGIGIEKGQAERLFEKYYRADNAAVRFEGLGLGLFISSEIIKRHNGTFWIESEPGKGSTFSFRLPLTN